MKSFIIGLMLAFSVMSVAHATDRTTIDTAANLTDAQKAQLAATAAKMASENVTGTDEVKSPSKTVENVKAWVDIGTAIGSGLAASAKELGVAANDFAQTPVGRFTVFMIAYHFIGGTILHVFFALLWFFMVPSILFYVWRRSFLRTTITTYDKGAGPNGATKTVVKEPVKFPNDSATGAHLFLGFGSAIFVIVLAIMLCNL